MKEAYVSFSRVERGGGWGVMVVRGGGGRKKERTSRPSGEREGTRERGQLCNI